MPITERDKATGRARTDDPKDHMMRLTESEHRSLKRMRDIYPKEPTIKVTKCHNCNRPIRAIIIDKNQIYFFCDLLVCKLVVLTMMGRNWIIYIDPKDHMEAINIIKRMNTQVIK